MIHDLTSGKNGWVYAPAVWPPRPERAARIREVLTHVRAQGGTRVELWFFGADARDDAAPLECGFRFWRELWQMRCPLPAAPLPPGFQTRAFTPADAEEFLRVNARAFAWHPEQGQLTRADLDAAQRESWFRPDGFLVHHIGGRLAGFCWTKIHPPDAAKGDPALGEIYAIAIDPDFHGRGLGRPMTLAGLDWLARQGLDTGMLYVEHDNHAAVKTYERIGFTVHHADRAYEREL